jgi:lipopolysaccharide heptosyltransferase II
MEAPDKVAILRFSALGDVILTSPALEALRKAWPKTRILFVVKERLQHLVANNPNVDEVIPLALGESPLSLGRRLRERHVDVVLDLHNKIRSKLIRATFPEVPWVVWHKRDFRDTVPVKLALRPYHASMLFADRYHAAVEQLVGRPLEKGRLQYFPGPGDRASGDAILRDAGIDPERPILGLSPGANWQTKRWPADRFGDLAARAIAAKLQVVVQGSADEKPLAEAVVARAPGTVDLTGRLDLQAMGGFISRCTAFVANDSGPMHMARGLGVPTLAIFGSTDPGMFSFQGHGLLFAGVECAPCSFFGRSSCPKEHFRCMLDLTVDQAWSALQPLLDGVRRPLVSA